MDNILLNNKMIEFFELLHKPVRSQEDLLINVNRALAAIEEDIHIGRVDISLSAPQTKLRSQINNLSSILYQRQGVYGYKPVTHSFRSGDGGVVNVTFYALDGYTWEGEELQEIRILCSLIFHAFRMEMMDGLLQKATKIDMAVGIPNIAGFMEFVTRKFGEDHLGEYEGIYFNIHNFKYVNNVLPQVKADEVMGMYVQTISKLIEADEILARLGGDNFVALIRTENSQRFIDYISNININYEYENDMKRFFFSATVGASKLMGLNRVGEVMIRISIAYQMARQHESTDVVYFKEEYYKDVARQKEVVAGFQRGLEQKEFVVHYQPKVSSNDKKICGAEALVRWKQMDNLIFPGEFIPVLEKDGSICKLDFYVLDKVCALLKKCMEEKLPLTQISVNFSRKHICNPYLVQEIVEVIDKYGVPHNFVEIELTESEDFRDYMVMAKLIRELKEVGISTSIDDFGTGYSSLNMLKLTGIDILKIDKSFIPVDENQGGNSKDCIMFENIARLSKDLGVKVVAEGVETEEQYDYLCRMGCDIIQGYYFDKPLVQDKFLEKLVIGNY